MSTDINCFKDIEAVPFSAPKENRDGKKGETDRRVTQISTSDTSGYDEAFKLAQELEGIAIDYSKESKLRRKIDLIILPVFAILFMVQFMDKTCIGFTAIMGIQEDYNMRGQMYPWLTSSFYLGYLCGAPLSAILMQRFPPVYISGICIITWGVIQCLMATPTNYGPLCLLRTLLGIFESIIAPIFVIMLNHYYKSSEHFGRMAFFYGFNGFGTVVLSGIAAGVYKYQGEYSMKGYKVLFVTLGVWTIAWGLLILLIIPNTPATAKFLSQEEKALLLYRIRENQQGFGTPMFKKGQLLECFKDVRTWIYFFIAVAVAIPNGGISSFSVIILKSFGYSTFHSLLMKAPLGAVSMLCLCGMPLLSKVVKSRLLLAGLYMAVVITGSSMLAFASKKPALAGFWLCGAAPIGIITVSSCVVSNTAGYTKKLAANAVSLAGYSAGNIIGPQTFRENDAPNYHPAKAAIVGCYSFAAVLTAVMAFVNIHENKRRDRIKEALGDSYQPPMRYHEFLDITDFENPEFRYSY